MFFSSSATGSQVPANLHSADDTRVLPSQCLIPNLRSAQNLAAPIEGLRSVIPFQASTPSPTPGPQPPPNVALDLLGGNNFSPLLGGIPDIFVDTSCVIHISLAPSSWFNLSTPMLEPE